MTETTMQYLIRQGFRMDLIGFQYLGMAIDLSLQNPKYWSKKGGLLETIAKRNNTTSGAVKRAIRYTISVSPFKNIKTTEVIIQSVKDLYKPITEKG